MKEKEFKNWLNQEFDYAKRTIDNRISNCKKINNYYNLDEYYDKNLTKKLIELLTYTKQDENKKNLSKHKIPINGNIYNGSATYKNAAILYFEFRDSQKENNVNKSIEKKEINKIDEQVFEIIKKINYKKNKLKNIEYLQNILFENLKEKVKNYNWEYEHKISKKYKDRIDIYGFDSKKNHHYVLELDPHRADSVAKKFVSRVALLINENITYISICYHGTKNMDVSECNKYFNYCDEIAKKLKMKYFGIIL